MLQEGDLLLAVNGVTLNRFREVEEATQAPRVQLTVLRDGAEKVVDVETAALRGEDIDRLLLWAGAVLHAPHRAMTIQRSIPPEGVFVAYFAYGSPATRYGLVCGTPHRRGGWTADPRPRCVHRRGARPRRSLVGAPEDGHLERVDRCHDAEARPELLADL